MPTKRKTPPAELPVDDISPEEFELADFIENFGASIARVYIYRSTRSGDPEWIDTVATTGLSEEVMRENYGPGRYMLKFKASDGTFKAHKTIYIGSTKPSTNGNGNGNHLVPAGPVPDQLAALEKANERQFQMILTLLGANKFDMPAMIGAFATLMSATNKQADLPQMIAALVQLKGATEPNQDMLKNIKGVLEVARELQPGGTTEESMYSVVKDVSHRIIDTFSGARVPVPGAPPAPGAAPSTMLPAAPGASAAATPEEARQRTVADWIRVGLEYLKDKARRAKDVAFWIDYLFENQEEPQCAALLGAISQGATFDQLLQFDKEIAETAALREWFQALYNGVQSELRQSLDPGGPGGDADHASENAGAGPQG